MLKTEQVAYNTGASAPTEPNREGYRFTGWDVSFENIMGDTIVTAQYEKEESIVPPTEPEQPQAPGQGGEMNNTEIKTQTGANLEAAKTGDDFIVEPLLVTGGISSIAATIAFFFRKKEKLNHKENKTAKVLDSSILWLFLFFFRIFVHSMHSDTHGFLCHLI